MLHDLGGGTDQWDSKGGKMLPLKSPKGFILPQLEHFLRGSGEPAATVDISAESSYAGMSPKRTCVKTPSICGLRGTCRFPQLLVSSQSSPSQFRKCPQFHLWFSSNHIIH